VEDAFGEVLRDLREQRGLSQEALALIGGLDRTFISLLERGLRQPSLTTVLQIAAALEIEPGGIVDDVNSRLTAPPPKKARKAAR